MGLFYLISLTAMDIFPLSGGSFQVGGHKYAVKFRTCMTKVRNFTAFFGVNQPENLCKPVCLFIECQ